MKIAAIMRLSPVAALFATALAASSALGQTSFKTPLGPPAPGFQLLCPNGSAESVPCGGATTPLAVDATVSASISGFAPASVGTPISVTTGGVTGSLPAGTVVVATNVGATNGAYCALGASATTAQQYIAPNGGWFAFTVGGATQLTCITSTSTTTVNMVGGAGLATGTGGGGGGGSGGSVTQGTSPWVDNITQIGGAALALGQTTMAASIPVALASNQAAIPVSESGTWNITNVSGTVSLPNGASTAAKQPAIGTAGTASTDVISIQGIASGTVVPTSVASLPLPTGAATSANQTSQITQETASAAALGTTADAAYAGSGSATLVAINKGLYAAFAAPIVAGTNIIGNIRIDQTTPGTTNAVALTQIGSTTVVTGGVAGSQSVGGPTASGATFAANPLPGGCRGQNAEPTAVANTQAVAAACDLTGKRLIGMANTENLVQGSTSAMTATTSTSLIAAPASGLRNYITQCTFSNSHATVGTMMILQDGSGGTTFYQAPAAPAFGGAALTFPAPLRQPTTATAVYVQNVTTGANTFASCSGYKGS